MAEILYALAEEGEEREVVFGETEVGMRLDAALAGHFPDLSRSRIQAILEEGLIFPTGLSKNTRVRLGDRIIIMVHDRVPLEATPEHIEIDVVYEDEAVVVVNKARGMVVHPGHGNPSGTLVNALLGRSALSSGSAKLRPGIVHRIDKNTSGLLVVAKNDAAHAGLAEQFSAHTITRLYEAIVLGGFREEAGTVDAPLGRDPKNRLKQAVLAHRGRDAVTHWRVLERFSGRCGVHTLLELSLETGRTHQIRVHMAATGHPVLGDELYGASRGLGTGGGQYLHARVLGFIHPLTGERLLFESPLPAYFEEMLTKLRRV